MVDVRLLFRNHHRTGTGTGTAYLSLLALTHERRYNFETLKNAGAMAKCRHTAITVDLGAGDGWTQVGCVIATQPPLPLAAPPALHTSPQAASALLRPLEGRGPSPPLSHSTEVERSLAARCGSGNHPADPQVAEEPEPPPTEVEEKEKEVEEGNSDSDEEPTSATLAASQELAEGSFDRLDLSQALQTLKNLK